ncbi:MAG: 3-methyl-2-oxobutanoate hydroxymethyltransferase [Thermoguttaceae bacterium]
MKITVPKFQMRKGEAKLCMLTAYDFTSARLADAAGIDAVLVGDSLGNVVQGKPTTLSVKLRDMIYHAEMVARAVSNALIVVDIPFPHCQLGPKEAVKAAAKIMKFTQADAVKIEGGTKRTEVIRAVVDAGIPVMGHCGLLPQDVKKIGKFSVQRNVESLFADVEAVEKAGVFSVVLECIPTDLAKQVTQKTSVPTIGIGAGPHCDGQVVVFHDMLGFNETNPKHVKTYANLGKTITDAVKSYCSEVRSGIFPGEAQSFE